MLIHVGWLVTGGSACSTSLGEDSVSVTCMNNVSMCVNISEHNMSTIQCALKQNRWIRWMEEQMDEHTTADGAGS